MATENEEKDGLDVGGVTMQTGKKIKSPQLSQIKMSFLAHPETAVVDSEKGVKKEEKHLRRQNLRAGNK